MSVACVSPRWHNGEAEESPCFIVLGARSTMDVAMELRADEWLEVATL